MYTLRGRKQRITARKGRPLEGRKLKHPGQIEALTLASVLLRETRHDLPPGLGVAALGDGRQQLAGVHGAQGPTRDDDLGPTHKRLAFLDHFAGELTFTESLANTTLFLCGINVVVRMTSGCSHR